MSREAIKDWTGKILGFKETDSKGNETVRGFNQMVVSRYDVEHNCTRDFYGRKLTEGNTATSMLNKK